MTSTRKPGPAWLDHSVFYEIYPQTFCDSNGDGIGDIPGITSKLDYIQSLGVNGIWLNPCFDSPFGDAGYDVSDFYKVAPRYGTNEDLVELFREANKRGIKVILDLVAGHTSTECAWFKESARHERNPYSDWFIWTDSVWGMPAPYENPVVRGAAERDGAYVPNFFHFQPALNYGYANPDPRYPYQQPVTAPGPQAVRREIKNIMKFWLDLGAAGFRVDMAFSLVKNDPAYVETNKIWDEYRSWLDQEYPEAILVSEWSSPIHAIPAGFHIDFFIHFNSPGYTALFRKKAEKSGFTHFTDSYSWPFFDRSGHGNIREWLDNYLTHYQATAHLGYISLPTGNHDMGIRLAHNRDTADLRVAYTFLMTVPGVPFIYYGDEIGMRTVEGLPSKEGGYNRTGARTPMQWDASANAGFSSAEPARLYLPIDPAADRPTVASQDADPHSLLNFVRELIQLRQDHPALASAAAFEPIFAEEGRSPFVFLRKAEGETILVAVNPAEVENSAPLPAGLITREPKTLSGQADAFEYDGAAWSLRLGPIAAGVYQL